MNNMRKDIVLITVKKHLKKALIIFLRILFTCICWKRYSIIQLAEHSEEENEGNHILSRSLIRNKGEETCQNTEEKDGSED